MTAKLRLAASLCVIALLLGWSAHKMATDPAALPLRDFVEYYSAGKVYLQGGNPYSGPELIAIQRDVLNKPELPEATMMWNPPWVFALVAPFSLLPAWVAHKVWLLVQIACVFSSVWMLWRTYGGPRGKEWIGWVTAATFPPVLFVVWWGQIGGLVLLGLSGYLYHVTRGRYVVAGLFAALTAIKPHLLFAFGLVLVLEALWSRAGRRVLVSGAAAFAAAAVAVAVAHPGVYDHYRSAEWTASSDVNVSPKDWYQPLISYWLRMAIDPNRFGLQFVPTGVTALVVVGYWWVRRKTWDWRVELPRLIFASVIAAAYGAWMFDLVVLLVPLVRSVAGIVSRVVDPSAPEPTPRPTRTVLERAKRLGYVYIGTMAVAVFTPTVILTPLTGRGIGLQFYVWFAPVIWLFCFAADRIVRPYNSPRAAPPGAGGRASSWRTPAVPNTGS